MDRHKNIVLWPLSDSIFLLMRIHILYMYLAWVWEEKYSTQRVRNDPKADEENPFIKIFGTNGNKKE